MGKQNDAMEISAWTTGGGLAIGTNVDIGGVLMGSAPTTLTLKAGLDGTATVMSISGASIAFAVPIASSGPLTGTSSGGSFAVLFKKRNV